MKTHNRLLKYGILSVILFALPMSAATITPTGAGTVTFTIITAAGDTTPLFFDFDGIDLVDFNDPGLIGSFFFTDSGGIGGIDPFPNTGMLGVDAISPTEGIVFSFAGASIIVTPGLATISGSAIPLGSLTDPALLGVVAGSPFIFSFVFDSLTSDIPIGPEFFDFYAYEFIGADNGSAIPEPTTVVLFGGGLLAMMLLRRRTAKR